MELGWILMMTLKLTRENILRIKETLSQIVAANPLLSAVIFMVIVVVILALILKHKNPA